MADTLGQSRETLTNQELQDYIWNGRSVSESIFKEPIRIGHSLKNDVDLKNCDFLQGLSMQGIRVAHDITFDGSRIIGDCYFERLQVSKILSLMDLNAADATFLFQEISVSHADIADLLLSFKDRDSIPELITDNAVIREMFRRLEENPTTLVSYNEVREELK